MKKIIPKYVSRRSEECIILNKFELLDANTFNNSFVFTINFLDTYKVKLNILQVSDYFIEIKIINILIYSMDLSEKQIITYYTNENNYEFKMSFEVLKKLYNNSNQKIPKTIIQTSTTNILPIYIYNSVMSHLIFNPDYEYKFFDDDDILNYLKCYCDEYTVNCFQSLIPGAYKADFFRYIYLYHNGGVYFDCKMISNISLDKIINEHDEFVCCKDRKYKAIYNAILFSIPNNIILKQTIEEMCKRIYNIKLNLNSIDKYLCMYGIYGITGTTLLYEIIEKNNIIPKFIYSSKTNMIHEKKHSDKFIKNAKYWNQEKIHEQILFIPFVSNYYEIYKEIHKNKDYYQTHFYNKNLVI